MSLSQLTSLKTHLGVSGTSQDDFLAQLLAAAEAAFLALVDRQIERATLTGFYPGRQSRVLLLDEYPLLAYPLEGTTASGSAVVTGLSSTASLCAGMPVSAPRAAGIPSGTTVSTIDSASQVTLSAAATASGASLLTFGLAAWEDSTGAWGASDDAFPAGTLLSPGVDYAPVRDGRGGGCESGRLVRLNGVWAGRWQHHQGLLTPVLRPSLGTVKVQFTCGYAAVPADVELCLWQCVAELRAMRAGGLALSSESFDGFSYSQMERDARSLLALPGSRQQVIARYRRKTPRIASLG